MIIIDNNYKNLSGDKKKYEETSTYKEGPSSKMSIHKSIKGIKDVFDSGRNNRYTEF